MSKLDVKEHKKLVLKNVIIHELRDIPIDQFEVEVDKFTKRLQLLSVQAFGPLITKSCGVHIKEDGTFTGDFDVLVQAHDYQQYKELYVTQEKHVCCDCLYLHFQGKAQDFRFAQSKMDLYLYEHDLEDSGITYTVFIKDSMEDFVADIFKVVVSDEIV